ncbi:MAG: GGDEF domain-containing protein [Candidatus Woesearchaeota archaeon]
MDNDLESRVGTDRRVNVWGRRRTDATNNIEGKKSYDFIKEYLKTNPQAQSSDIPIEHIMGLVRYAGSLEGHAAEEFHNARHDTLTNIPNRYGLEEELKGIIEEADEHKTNVTYAFFDIDNFKAINTEHTHDMGDLILMALGESLGNCIRTGDYAGRVGGEEFVIIIKDTMLGEGLNVAARMKNYIESYIRQQYADNLVPTDITVSMGVSNYTGNSGSVAELQSNAKEALQRAKTIPNKGSVVYKHPDTGELVVFENKQKEYK